jgi:hypothetical protein
MKIAISGSACTGKTTLGRELAKQLGFTFIPEHFEPLFALGKRSDTKQRVAAFRKVLGFKSAEEGKHEDFVADRCPLDLMNLWLATGLGRRPKLSAQFYGDCRKQMELYDRIVILPWGRLPLEPRQADDGSQVRNLNPWSLLHNHATIVGLARMWLRRDQLIMLRGKLDTVEQRAAFVLERVRKPTH